MSENHELALARPRLAPLGIGGSVKGAPFIVQAQIVYY
jgi:hypothetical protein